MSNRFDRESEHSSNERSSTSIMRVLGQMLLLPFTVFVYGMEVFVKTIHSVQKIADDGLDLTAGSVAPSPEDARAGGRDFTSVMPVIAQASGQSIGALDTDAQTTMVVNAPTSSTSDSLASDEIELSETKEATMDKDLRDDMLKLVKYKVLFVKREYEHAFQEKEDLVSENMDGAAFTAWKVAEFIQELQKRRTEVPAAWGKVYPEKYRDGNTLIGLPDDDKKYLRIYYEVMDRYPREKFKYEEEKISVLEDIRDELKKKTAPTPGNGSKRGDPFDEITKRLEANKFRLKYQRQGFQLGHDRLSKDVSKAFAKFINLGEFEALEISPEELAKAFKDGVKTPFDPAGLNSFPGKWKGVNRHYGLDGKEIVADATTWFMTWSDGEYSNDEYVQTVVGSKLRHYTADELPDLSERKVDLALNLYRKEIGITGWLSTFVEFRNEMALIAYELSKGAFLWIGQVLTEKLEPVENEKLFWMFFEWYAPGKKPNLKPNYYMYGLMFEIDFEAGTARHFEPQGVRKARFDLIG